MPLDASLGTPLDMVGMDANTVAIRMTGGPLVLLDLADRQALRAELRASGNQLILSFYSAGGATYRIERSESVINPSWTVLRDNIAGTGDRIDEAISSDPARPSFYRVVRL